MPGTRRAVLLGPLAVACLLYLVVPQKSVPQVLLYQGTALWALGVAVTGVLVHRPVRRRVWTALLAGLVSWVVGDVLWAWAVWIARDEPFPSWADLFFLSGYVLLGLGLFWLVRGRQPGRNRAALIDATIVAAGVGVVTSVFVILPLAADSTQSVLGRVVGSIYPLADIVLLGMLVRLVSTPGARSASYRLLVASMAASLLADVGYNLITIGGGGSSTPRWLDATWLACYSLLAASALSPSMKVLSEPAPDREEQMTRTRMVAMAGASALAPITLLVQHALDQPPSSLVVAGGSLTLSALVLVRMAGLLKQVRAQAVQLAALASLDGLTGIPNRRTWDHELSRACAAARDDGTPLAVALLDLDHFKAFNDTHGHQAGDELLQQAARRWRSGLAPTDLLARYGGEEFAVLMPGRSAAEAVEVLQGLQERTPGGQSFSAGLAMWRSSTRPDDTPGSPPEAAGRSEEPAAAVARADEALYLAKRNGRARVQAWGHPPAEPVPRPAVADRSDVTPLR